MSIYRRSLMVNSPNREELLHFTNTGSVPIEILPLAFSSEERGNVSLYSEEIYNDAEYTITLIMDDASYNSPFKYTTKENLIKEFASLYYSKNGNIFNIYVFDKTSRIVLQPGETVYFYTPTTLIPRISFDMFYTGNDESKAGLSISGDLMSLVFPIYKDLCDRHHLLVSDFSMNLCKLDMRLFDWLSSTAMELYYPNSIRVGMYDLRNRFKSLFENTHRDKALTRNIDISALKCSQEAYYPLEELVFEVTHKSSIIKRYMDNLFSNCFKDRLKISCISGFNCSLYSCGVSQCDGMFYGCSGITSANIPSYCMPSYRYTLADLCYRSMFEGCISLVNAPALPATTLAFCCYESMFEGCASLVNAPALPATTLVEYCYESMFFNCYSLVNAPALSATTLAEHCYDGMFFGCTSLITAPVLPATALSPCCYYDMFMGCTSLVNTPALPATTLSKKCYSHMFSNCTSLVNAPALPAKVLSDYCYSYMFAECTSLVNAPALPATTLASSCYDDMFSKCTSLANAPALPAMVLSDYCYSYMFAECTSLVNAPALPATTLASSCYSNMFYGCTSLVNAPALPAMVLSDYCYFSMFAECTRLVNAPALPAITLAKSCYANMFSGCTSLKYGPPYLPAITLLPTCYSSMFFYCALLISAPFIFASIPSQYACQAMFNYCYTLSLVYMGNMESRYISTDSFPTFLTNTGQTTNCYLILKDTASSISTSCIATRWQKYTEETFPYTIVKNLSKSSNYFTFYNATNILFQYNVDSTVLGSGTTSTDIAFYIPGYSYAIIYSSNNSKSLNNSYIYNGMPTAFFGRLRLYDNSTKILQPNLYLGLFADNINLYRAPLLYPKDYLLGDGCYSYMFMNCVNLTSAPELPATILATNCYASMFYGCRNLLIAPELPAMILSDYCYAYMFLYCTSLITAPVLPAIMLYPYCYASMFEGCTSLEYAPELPAMILSDYCYELMFSGCTSLSYPTLLPALTLAPYCYESMFFGCSNLIAGPPYLPALTLVPGCYNSMFQYCKNLIYAPFILATDSNNEYESLDALNNMFNGCEKLSLLYACFEDVPYAEYWLDGVSSTGSYINGNPNIVELLDYTYQGDYSEHRIPGGWAVYTEYTYPYMIIKNIGLSQYIIFDNPTPTDLWYTYICYNILTLSHYLLPRFVPIDTYGLILLKDNDNRLHISQTFTNNNDYLNIRSAAKVAYYGSVICLLHSKDDLTEYAFKYLFKDSVGMVRAPLLLHKNYKLAQGCYEGMFLGCTSLTTAPNLPATMLAAYCYYNMFYGCTSLITAPELPASVLYPYCYDGMFFGCTNLTAGPPYLPAVTLKERCYSYMFYNCSSLISAPFIFATSIPTSAETLTYMFKGCSSLSIIYACFDRCPSTNAWLDGVAASGSYICGNSNAIESVPWVCPSRTGNTIPYGWDIYTEYTYPYMIIKNLMPVNNTLYITRPEELNLEVLLDDNSIFNISSSGLTMMQNDTISFPINGYSFILVRSKKTTNLIGTYRSPNDITRIYTSVSAGYFGSALNIIKAGGGYTSYILPQHALDSLFINNTTMLRPPVLGTNNVTISLYAYYGMFSGCENIQTAPPLLSTITANSCYGSMFDRCINLIIPPVINNLGTWQENCCSSMFMQCYNLLYAPPLYGTSVMPSCFAYMFMGCISITSAPILSASNVATNAYESMFFGCTNLTSATINAVTLLTCSLMGMFMNCINLRGIYITSLTTPISSTNAGNWLLNISSTGNIYVAPNASWVINGIYGLPPRWNIIGYVADEESET